MRREIIRKIVVCILLMALAVPAEAAPDTPEEFSDWFVHQNFQGQEYHQWAAVLSSLIDGIDRSREAHLPIVEPVYVAIISGVKYHTTEDCSALKLASRVLELDLTEAQERGFEACSRCEE